MRSLLAAFRFLSTLPLPGAHDIDEADWGRATAWYPLVGQVLGAILGGLDQGFHLLWPEGVASALLLVAWVALTGALHLDGFVDCCDALLVSAPAGRRLEILRDVHVGAFGVVGAVLLLWTKYAALCALPGTLRLPSLLVVPVLARWGMAGAVLLYPYARTGDGLGRRARTGSGGRELAVGTATAVLAVGVAGWLGLGRVAWALLPVAAVATWVVAQWTRSRIGGLTGDAYGAICELGETFMLLALVALAHSGALS